MVIPGLLVLIGTLIAFAGSGEPAFAVIGIAISAIGILWLCALWFAEPSR